MIEWLITDMHFAFVLQFREKQILQIPYLVISEGSI